METPPSTPPPSASYERQPLRYSRRGLVTPNNKERMKRKNILRNQTNLKLTPHKGGTTSVMFYNNDNAIKMAVSDVINPNYKEAQLLEELNLATKAGIATLGPEINTKRSKVVEHNGEYYLILFMKKLEKPTRPLTKLEMNNIRQGLYDAGINIGHDNHPAQYMMGHNGKLKFVNYGRAQTVHSN